MGGRAFAKHDPPLYTPRMPLAIYNQVLDHALTCLRKHYIGAAAPIEGPGKETYGDVDILVHGPLSQDYDPLATLLDNKKVAHNLATLFDAAGVVAGKGDITTNLAVPWPGEDDKYVQIDIQFLPSRPCYEWELFHHAHGDLWNILGTTSRPFGLTANNIGLYLRIPEIELIDRKRSMIFLTSQPSSVLKFFGLDEKRWWKQFGSWDELFWYATTCRMFWVKEDSTDEKQGDVDAEIGGQEGGEAGKKKLKHNDRRRMSQRPLFRAWIDEFIPKLRESDQKYESRVTRAEIRDEAFEEFGIKEEYLTRLKDFKMERHIFELENLVIKGGVPSQKEIDPAFRGAAIRTLKAIIIGGEPFEGAVPKAALKDAAGFHNLPAVEAFVAENWKQAGKIGLMALVSNNKARARKPKSEETQEATVS